MNNKQGEEIFDINIDDLFKDEEDSQLPNDDGKGKLSPEQMTKAVSERINTVRKNTEKETQDKIAKELGYETYEAMKKAQDDKIVKDQGYDPEDIQKVIDPIIKKRLEDDPRFKKLEEFEKREREEYVKAQLEAINETTGLKLKAADLSKETLDLWAKGVELEQAYYATNGKTIISGKKEQLENGSLAHLANSSGAGSVKTRGLTNDEKEIWRGIVPGITEEELSKKTTPVGD